MLAGSIVEATLMDALVSKGRPIAEVEKLRLAPLISAALAAKVISVQTHDAAKPVKDYRNHIHPAVQLRAAQALGEIDAEAAIPLMRW